MPAPSGIDEDQEEVALEMSLKGRTREFRVHGVVPQRRLEGLIAQGRPITLAVLPGAEHGMTECELTTQGRAGINSYAPGYFDVMCDFAVSGRLQSRYGQSMIRLPTR
jgi:hypothetical protein